jgi:hypothetical protein
MADEKVGMNGARPKERFTADERNAMRAYLQRCEVRLSTMHRVAVGFISGAGLLFLFPVFLKDGVLALIRAMLDYAPAFTGGTELGQRVALVVIYLCLLYPFILSLAIPAAALLLLLKDIVRFYFVGHVPGFSHELFNPRFGLTAVAFSPDESEAVKARVLRYEYGTDLINFVISRADVQSRYYSNLIDRPRRMIVPRSRKLPRLIDMNVIGVPSGKPLEALDDNETLHVHGTYANGEEAEALLHEPYVQRTLGEVDGFNAALGLAGLVDRPLYQEVAKTEVSLVRHALKLRRLVLRYFQALLILLWTSLITFLMLPFLDDRRFPLLTVFSVAYFVWAVLAPAIVQLPLDWLASYPTTDERHAGVRHFQRTDTLHRFGKITQRLCYVALAGALIALALEALVLLR